MLNRAGIKDRLLSFTKARYGDDVEQAVREKLEKNPDLEPIAALNEAVCELRGGPVPTDIESIAFNTD
ncbi:MAG: hypothetical protein Q7S15_02585 [bacterium]|nr:hypothetical protein [bacterium]